MKPAHFYPLSSLPFLACLVVAMLAPAGCTPRPETALSLDPVPFDMSVPPGILPRLSTGPVEGPFGEQVARAGALGSTTIYYQPIEQSEKIIFMTAYFFPAEKFDPLQSPDQPPMFGTEVLRKDGMVLSVAGPLDAVFAPDTPDGRDLTALYGVIYLPETYRSLP